MTKKATNRGYLAGLFVCRFCGEWAWKRCDCRETEPPDNTIKPDEDGSFVGRNPARDQRGYDPYIHGKKDEK